MLRQRWMRQHIPVSEFPTAFRTSEQGHFDGPAVSTNRHAMRERTAAIATPFLTSAFLECIPTQKPET